MVKKKDFDKEFKKKKNEYLKKFQSITTQDLNRIVSLLALKDVTIDALVHLLIKKKVIKKTELNDLILKELK